MSVSDTHPSSREEAPAIRGRGHSIPVQRSCFGRNTISQSFTRVFASFYAWTFSHEIRLLLYLDPADSLLFGGETQAGHSVTSLVLSRTWDRDKREEEVRSLARAENKFPEHGD